MSTEAGPRYALVVTIGAENEEIFGRNVVSAPGDFANLLIDQSQSQGAGRRAAPLRKATAEGDMFEARAGGCDPEQRRIETAPVELPPVEVPLGGRFGELVDAPKRILEYQDRVLQLRGDRVQRVLRANS